MGIQIFGMIVSKAKNKVGENDERNVILDNEILFFCHTFADN
jgi:hypothetical protein